MTKPDKPPSSMWDLDSEGQSRFSDSRLALDFKDEAFRRGEARGQFKQICRNGARCYFAASGGSGISDVVRFRDGIEINVNNFVLPKRYSKWHDAAETRILLRASLCCDVVFKVEGSAAMVFNRPELTLVCLPKGMRMTVDAQSGVRQQGVNGLFSPGAFTAAYGLLPDDLPPLVRDAVLGVGSFGRVVSLPLDHRVASLVADTIDTRLDGEMRAVQYAGRLAELVAYTLDAVRNAQSTAVGQVKRWRDADLAYLALERLAREYRQPPLFNALAHELGTNPNKLKALFKAAFGVTMAEYCLERRMREAQQLLLEGKLSVAQVAERVGYGHQSNFATAFSRHTGMSPREYLRHRAPINMPLDMPGGAIGWP